MLPALQSLTGAQKEDLALSLVVEQLKGQDCAVPSVRTRW